MYTIYALIILVAMGSLVAYVLLGKMGLFGFFEEKTDSVRRTMSKENSWKRQDDDQDGWYDQD